MPTYLLHGFRWQRQAIRIHVAFYNIDDAAPDWLMAPATSLAMHASFYQICDFLPSNEAPISSTPRSTSENESSSRAPEGDAPTRSFIKRMASRASLSALGRKQRPPSINNEAHGKGHIAGSATAVSSNGRQSPDLDSRATGKRSASVGKTPRFNEWSSVKLLEQYDPNDQIHPYQEYAYVGDYAAEVTLGASISEEAEKYQKWISSVREGAWIEKLRDKLQAGADIGWYVVVCGDEDRFASDPMDASNDGEIRGDSEITHRDSRTSGLKSFFRKKSVDSRNIADDETSALGKDSRVSQAESQLQLERKKSSGKPLPASPTAP